MSVSDCLFVLLSVYYLCGLSGKRVSVCVLQEEEEEEKFM